MECIESNGIIRKSILETPVKIIFAAIKDYQYYNRWLGALDKIEKKRISNYKFKIHAQRFAARRFLAKKLLQEFMSVDENLSFSYSEYGKPILPDKSSCFNWSFSEDYIAFVFSDELETGIDIECINSEFKFTELWNKIVFDKSIEKNHENFYRIWTAMEALQKCKGDGISKEFFAENPFSFNKISGSIELDNKDYLFFQLKIMNSIISVVSSNVKNKM